MTLYMKRYLVVGAGGRLGRSFIEVLCKNNIDCVTDLRLLYVDYTGTILEEQKVLCAAANISVEWMVVDITRREILYTVLEDVDVVIHLEEVVDYEGQVTAEKMWRVNVQAVSNLLEVCCQKNVRHLVYTSSVRAIGPNSNREPMHFGNEKTHYEIDHVTEYGYTKYKAEKLVLSASGRRLQNSKHFHTCSLRLPTIYGGLDDPIILQVIYRHHKSKVISTPCDPNHAQVHMRIENAAWAHVLAAKAIQENPYFLRGCAYYVGDNTPNMSYDQLAARFLKSSGFELSYRKGKMPFWLFYCGVILLYYVTTLINMFGKIFGKTVKEPVSPTYLKTACVPFTFSHRKFSKRFYYQPLLSWKESFLLTQMEVESIYNQLMEEESNEK
ncbi:unnamed protein product [Clavelina lepadiformis]|uniref:3-beta hydroxysteroid dehydrogenase/isomerase domain-containing protein n=1 Tax=Clavelina lepadiformis TaxID=159417 RepID=A0ABP0G640_CLALP